MLASLGGELNLMAKVLINGSNWVLAVGLFFLLFSFHRDQILQWRKTEKGGMAFDQVFA